MPLFHFEIVNGFRIEDPVGLNCKNEDQARTVALDIARHIATDVPSSEKRTVVVLDDEGREVFATPVRL